MSTYNISAEKRQQIRDAADRLCEKGMTNPTNQQVLAELGTGSLGYITPVMRDWRNEQKQAALAQEQMPAHLKQLMLDKISYLWEACKEASDSQLVELQERKAEEQRLLLQERNELVQENIQLDQKLAQVKELVQSIKEQVKTLREDNQKLSGNLLRHKALSEKLELRTSILERENKDLKENYTRLFDELSVLREERQRLRDECERLNIKLAVRDEA